VGGWLREQGAKKYGMEGLKELAGQENEVAVVLIAAVESESWDISAIS
jgi:hypothetical protein